MDGDCRVGWFTDFLIVALSSKADLKPSSEFAFGYISSKAEQTPDHVKLQKQKSRQANRPACSFVVAALLRLEG
jgi:hypothetical protein